MRALEENAGAWLYCYGRTPAERPALPALGVQLVALPWWELQAAKPGALGGEAISTKALASTVAAMVGQEYTPGFRGPSLLPAKRCTGGACVDRPI